MGIGYVVKREEKVHSNFDWRLQCWRCNNHPNATTKYIFSRGITFVIFELPILLKSYNKVQMIKSILEYHPSQFQASFNSISFLA